MALADLTSSDAVHAAMEEYQSLGRDEFLRPLPPAARPTPMSRSHVAAPMRGNVVSLTVSPGQRVERGDRLATIEAMKMETAVVAEVDGVVEEVVAAVGTHVNADDLLLVVQVDGEDAGED